MSIELSDLDLVLVERFFSGANQLKWKDIQSGSASGLQLNQVIPWLNILSEKLISELPIILPLYKEDGEVIWYGVAQNDQIFAQLCAEINSFVGLSYADIRIHDHENNNEQVKAIKERFGSRIVSFTSSLSTTKSKIEEALLIYQKLLLRRPKVPNRMQRPFGKVRADFDRALLAGNTQNAQLLLDELITSGKIDSAQQKCLEIRMLAGLGRQSELARNHSLIDSVVDLPLPAQILVDIIDSLYETYIRPNETNSDFEVVLKGFENNIIRPFKSSLFKDRKGIRHPTVLRSFLLFELSKENPSRKRCDSILLDYVDSAEGCDLAKKWYGELPNEVLTKEITNAQTVSVEQVIKEALADEDYETAYNLCLKWTPINYWIYSSLLRCANEISNLNIKKNTLDFIGTLSEDIISKSEPKDINRIESLKAVCELNTNQESKLTWVLWAESVNNGASFPQSIKVLKDNVTKWSVDEYIHEPDLCINLAKLIGESNNTQLEIYRSAFPDIVEFFVERPDQDRRISAFIPIYVAIIEVLALSGSLSPDELEIVCSLFLVLMSNGPSKSTYVESVEFLGVIVDENNSIINLDWALNISELLILYTPVDDGNSRMTFFNKVISIVMASPHRVIKSQIDLLQLLAKDYAYDLSAVLLLNDGQLDADPSNNINFKGFIGIYTLTEGAGSRAKILLEGYFPNARVETNNDHEATDKLKSLARNADIFVFAWKSSKHQAFFCVKEARKNKETAFPLGKGTASIVNSALEYIR